MTQAHRYEDLEAAVLRIARHPESPERVLAIAECLEDIEGRFDRGTLTAEQRGRLLEILMCEGHGPGCPAGQN